MRNIAYGLLCLLLISITISSEAQSLLIQGTILDSAENKGTPFAHVFIQGTSFGTVSNLDGKYALHISKRYEDSTLVVSSVGFNSKQYDLSQYSAGTNTLDVRLTYSKQFLQNVTITPQDASELWLSAIKNFRKMFTTPQHTLKGYYRTTFQEDGYFSRLLDAAINLHGGGRPTSRSKIEYVQLRKSADLRKNVWKIYDGYLNHLVYNHPVRNSYDFLSKNGIKRYQIEVIDKQYQDDDLFYTLLAESSSKGMHDVEMMIRERDYSIHRIVIKWKPENSNDFSWAWERKDSAHFFCDWQTSTYEYQEYDGKMYQQLARWHRSGKVIDDKTGKIRFLTESIDELLITDVLPRAPEKISKVPMQISNIYEMADYFEYDAEFWSNYNRPVDSEYFLNARKKMEGYAPLEQQYKEFSGKKVATLD